MGLQIPSPNLPLPPKYIDFRLQTSLIYKKKKAVSNKKYLLGVPQKILPKNFSKFTKKYLFDSLFLALLKAFKPSHLQL